MQDIPHTAQSDCNIEVELRHMFMAQALVSLILVYRGHYLFTETSGCGLWGDTETRLLYEVVTAVTA